MVHIMHTIKGGWVGQTYAFAMANDSGDRKSRIRRSKEERKELAESFIKKYQKSNNGNFPSLNLTHKKVGGSFYTVREIVREIIQENRVLGPPKLSPEEDKSGLVEQYPVGSISFDPQNGVPSSAKAVPVTDSASDQDQISSTEHISNPNLQFPFDPQNGVPSSDRALPVTDAASDQYQITSAEHFSNLNLQFREPVPVELDNTRIFNGPSKADEKDETSTGSNVNHFAIGPDQDRNDEVLRSIEPSSDDQVVNGRETFEKDQERDEQPVINITPIHEDAAGETSVLFSVTDEQILDKSSQTNERTKAVTSTETVVNEVLDGEKYEVKVVGTSKAIISHKKPEVVVETFPLRPVSKTIHDLHRDDSKVSDVTGTLEEKAAQHEGMAPKSSSGLIVREVEEKLPSAESSDLSVTAEANLLDGSVVKDVEANNYLPDGTKANGSAKQSILKEPSAVGRKPHLQDNGRFEKESNAPLDRINLETWERTSKISADTNPLLTLFKGFISAFVKFWSE